jgi:beta-glucosidase
MNRYSKIVLILLPIVLLVLVSYAASSLEYPFLDSKLSDDERLTNLISLMTLDEKLSHLSPMLPGIPRLGVKGTSIVEGLHGLALSGPANWAV